MAKIRISLDVEDRIVLLRLLTGLAYGVVVFAATLFVNPVAASPYVWATSVLVYYATVIYVALKYRVSSRFQLYLRGLATFYAAWLLTAMILHDIFRVAGWRS